MLFRDTKQVISAPQAVSEEGSTTIATSSGQKPSYRAAAEQPVALSFPQNHLDTSDWQIYRNEELGFEVQYPRQWEAHDNKNIEDYDRYVGIKEIFFGDPNDASFSGLDIRVYHVPLERIISDQTHLLGSPANDGVVLQKVRVGETDGFQQIQLTYEDKLRKETGDYIFGDSKETYFIVDLASDDLSLLITQKILLSFKIIN